MKSSYVCPTAYHVDFDIEFHVIDMLFDSFFHGCKSCCYSYVRIAMAIFMDSFYYKLSY